MLAKIIVIPNLLINKSINTRVTYILIKTNETENNRSKINTLGVSVSDTCLTLK